MNKIINNKNFQLLQVREASIELTEKLREKLNAQGNDYIKFNNL